MSHVTRLTPSTLFRIFATGEAITWAGLITALILRATGVTDAAVPVAGGVHGFMFLAYCVVTVFVWVNQRWRTGTGLLGLFLAVIPFATVPFEIYLARRQRLAGPWRLRPGGEEPRGFVEHLQALILRRPVTSVVILLAAVTATFLILLWLGPPIPKS